MNERDFREFGKAAIDYIADYNENLRNREVLPYIEPGYLFDRIPSEAPTEGESWQNVLEDVEKHIMPGMTHWNSPNFHAYYPAANSYPAIVGEMMCAGMNCIGFSWMSSPACTELEIIMMDWLAKMMALPKIFLNSDSGPGGGCLQSSASETALVTMLAARELTVERYKKQIPDLKEEDIRSRLIAYTSDQANGNIEKSARLSALPMRFLLTDAQCRLPGPTLLESIKNDIANGLIPCYVMATLGTTQTCSFDNLNELGPICNKYNIWLHVDAAYADQANGNIEKSARLSALPMRFLLTDAQCRLPGPTLLESIKNDIANVLIPCYVMATLGTTQTCSFDNLNELGPICNKYNIWLHVDAAYAGAALICPELRQLMTGIEYANSFNFNPHKWLLINFDCSALWVKDTRQLTETLNVERIYLTHHKQGVFTDFRHWQIQLGRRFRALKVWFVLRTYGVEGLQKYIRHLIQLAKLFEQLVRKDSRFEVPVEPKLGLVCFKIKGENDLTKQLIDRLTTRRKIYVIPALYREKTLVRFVVCSRYSIADDIIYAWNEISQQTTEILGVNSTKMIIKTELINYPSSDIENKLKNLELDNKKLKSALFMEESQITI